MLNTVAIVAIGRNEGDRLKICLKSVVQLTPRITVYVDSGSTDGSIAFAKSVGCEVVELDLSTPFSAGRARNAGYKLALERHPNLRYIQFIDGDCEIAADWVSSAVRFLEQNPEYAVVCGRRRERYPENSIYNRLIDIEWNTPIGEAKSCGGDALIRVSAMQSVDGFRNDLIAGEEPELCIRLRRMHHKIMRLDHEMTLHDAAILKFAQWWRRSVRTGYGFAAGRELHGAAPERHWVKESRSAWFWGLLIPTTILSLACVCDAHFGWLFAVYPAQVCRIALKRRRKTPYVLLYAASLIVGKFPEMYGQFKYWWHKKRYATPQIIEYK